MIICTFFTEFLFILLLFFLILQALSSMDRTYLILIFVAIIFALNIVVCARIKNHVNGFAYNTGCKPSVINLVLTHPGCRDLPVQTYGCEGYCRSETEALYDIGYTRIGIKPRCDCCKVEKYIWYQTYLCNNVVKRFPIATRCKCRPCSYLRK